MAEVSPSFRRGSVPAAIDTRFLDHLPSAVMLCDPSSLVIRYANGRSVTLLESLRHMLPVSPEEMVGSPLTLLHPAFEELAQLLSETGDSARKLVLTGNGERLEFHAHALRDMNGRPGFLQITWSVATAIAAQEDEVAKLRHLVEQLPLSVMTCRLSDLTIDYANAAARAAFERVRAHLPGAGASLVGASVDLFLPREKLAHVNALPMTVEVPAGETIIVLKAMALRSAQGQYLAPLLTFEVRASSLALMHGAGTSGAGTVGLPVIRTDDVLESLKASIGRIRTVTETIERMSAQGRTAGAAGTAPAPAPVTAPGDAAVPPAPVLPQDVAAGAPDPSRSVAPELAKAQSLKTPLAETPPRTTEPGETEPGETAGTLVLGYAERFSRRVGRLLRPGR